MTAHPMAFDDVRVLDLSTRLSGAFCARLFGDWGADVTLVEPPSGHQLRREPPFLDGEPGPERSLLHAYANANKRSAMLTPDDIAGRETLLRWADVVITTEPGEAEDIRARVRPDVVWISVTPHGLDGPLAGAPGNDLSAYALSGWASLNGDPGRSPLKGSANQAGYVAGLQAFVGGAAAVLHRARALARGDTAAGQLIDVSELEALTLIAGPPILVAQYAGEVAPRHRPDIVRGPVPCADGHFSLTISRAQFWRDAMTVLGLHDLAEDERYSQAWYRRQQREHYSGRVEEQMRSWTRRDLFEALAAVRCVAGMVLDTREINADPHLAARGFFAPLVVHDEAGGRQPADETRRSAQFPGAPLKMSATPWALRLPAPALGRSSVQDGEPGSIAAVSTGANARGTAAPSVVRPPRPDEVEQLGGMPPHRQTQRMSPPPRRAGEKEAGGSGPLTGVRAIVLTQAWSGTFATELLGLLGAEVIQVEARRRPDSWRGDYTGAVPAAIRDASKRQRPWNTNGLYNAVNLNKRAITLDLSHPRGLDLFKRLIVHADIVAENFTPRVLGNLGLDYPSLCRLKPDIILASLSAYGATGPYANIPGIGGTIEPMSGMSALLGYEDGPPQNSGAMYPDPVAGSYCAAALIMALRHRDRTGQGQYIDLGMMEANATFIGDALLEASANGVVRPRMGNHHPRIAPHNIYAARDGRWLALSADDDAMWRALASFIGRPDLTADPRFATMAGRKANEWTLDAIVTTWAIEQDADDAAAALVARGVVAARVRDTLDVLDHPQLRSRGLFVEVAHPEAGRHPQAGVPWRFSRTPAAVTRPAPMLGEHSREVLAEYLGVTDTDYDELVARGVTGDMPPE